MTSAKNESGDIRPDASISGVQNPEFLDESKCNGPAPGNSAIELVSVAVQSEKREWNDDRKVHLFSDDSEISRSGITIVGSVTLMCGTSKEASTGICKEGTVLLKRDFVKRKRPSV